MDHKHLGIEDYLKMVNLMDTEFVFIIMEKNILVCIKMEREMEKAVIFGQTKAL